MNKKMVWVVLAIIIIVLIIISISNSFTSSSSIKIGIITDLSSSASGVYGVPLQKGINLALSEVNDPDQKYEALYEDYRLDAKSALPAYESLKLKGAKIFIVDGSSGISVIAPEAKKDGNIILNPSSFIPSYKDGNPLTCRIAMTTDTYAPAYADFVINKLGKKKVALLIPNYEPGVALRNEITKQITSLGGTIVDTEMYLKDTTDFRTQIAKIKSAGQVDVLITMNYFTSVQTMFSQIKELGLNTQIVSDDWTISNQALKDVSITNGSYFVGYSYSGDNPQTDYEKAFSASFQKQYGSTPKLESIMGYDLVHILDKAITGSKSTKPIDIANYIVTTMKDYEGAGGKISFNSDCEVTRIAQFRQVIDGKVVDVR